MLNQEAHFWGRGPWPRVEGPEGHRWGGTGPSCPHSMGRDPCVVDVLHGDGRHGGRVWQSRASEIKPVNTRVPCSGRTGHRQSHVGTVHSRDRTLGVGWPELEWVIEGEGGTAQPLGACRGPCWAHSKGHALPGQDRADLPLRVSLPEGRTVTAVYPQTASGLRPESGREQVLGDGRHGEEQWT